MRLDLLCLGASPEKLAAAEIAAAAVDAPLTEKGRARLSELTSRRTFSTLNNAEKYELAQLLRRAGR